MRITSDQNKYDFLKQLRPVTMLKKEAISQLFSCTFGEFLHNETFCELFFKFLDDCF